MCLINKAKVKELALSISRNRRNGHFTRVSGKFLERIESRLRVVIEKEIEVHPSLGCTLK